ncbi:DUF2934 domain-containing protein [Marichromatium bheemlicum]|uniref:DUF2934 domain-containing protein n=1 Tax=Marichromatium bheemlicum TaxID=365339 RepID=A0ABX1I7A3_9GAMM|nr:DUF2934 domain-containing protein [Marichromatium bheemlicum]NKN33138.1 DUF2934 domain-containing protein [Marichromatium bheemlicum]
METNRRPSAARRHQMIAVAAYYLAEQRGFAPGGAEADWLAAERAVDVMLAVAATGVPVMHGLRLLEARQP